MYVISSMSEICVEEVKYRKKDMEKMLETRIL